jgi:hypothetical protein
VRTSTMRSEDFATNRSGRYAQLSHKRDFNISPKK